MTSVFNIVLCAVLLQIVSVITRVLCLNLPRVHQLAHCLCNMHPMHTHERDYPH